MGLVASSYQGTDGLPFAIVGIVLGSDTKTIPKREIVSA